MEWVGYSVAGLALLGLVSWYMFHASASSEHELENARREEIAKAIIRGLRGANIPSIQDGHNVYTAAVVNDTTQRLVHLGRALYDLEFVLDTYGYNDEEVLVMRRRHREVLGMLDPAYALGASGVYIRQDGDVEEVTARMIKLSQQYDFHWENFKLEDDKARLKKIQKGQIIIAGLDTLAQRLVWRKLEQAARLLAVQ